MVIDIKKISLMANKLGIKISSKENLNSRMMNLSKPNRPETKKELQKQLSYIIR